MQLEGDALAVAVVKLMKIRPPWVLCLDRTTWKIGRRDVNNLMLAGATRRLRIPLMWTVLDKAGASNQRERVALMRRYLALFGPRSRHPLQIMVSSRLRSTQKVDPTPA